MNFISKWLEKRRIIEAKNKADWEYAHQRMLMCHAPVVNGKITVEIINQEQPKKARKTIWHNIKKAVRSEIGYWRNEWRILNASEEEWAEARHKMLMCHAPVVNGKTDITEVKSTRPSKKRRGIWGTFYYDTKRSIQCEYRSFRDDVFGDHKANTKPKE